MQIAHANAAQAQVMVLHDIRAVHDIASLGWLIPPMSKSRWVIARIEPATGSGAGTVPGGYIDGATGKFVAPPNASPVTIRKGSWTLIGGGSESPGKARPYDWTQPVQQPGRVLAPEDMYSPFVQGGVVAFLPGKESGDRDFFRHVNLLFPDLANDMAAALAYLQEPGIVREPKSDGDAAHLRAMLGSDNEVLAAAALSLLVKAGRFTAADADDLLVRAKPRLDAILIYSLLAEGRTVEPLIQRARDPDRLRWMALGALAADVFGASQATLGTSARSALAAARDRLSALGSRPDSDEYLRIVFDRAQSKQ